MGQKVNPNIFRLGKIYTWKSRWFAKGKEYRQALEEDQHIRTFLTAKLKDAYVSSVEIERSANTTKVLINTSRPGMIIGRGGGGIDVLQKEITKMISSNHGLKINIQEIKNPDANAAIVAQGIAEALEKRMPYRRVMKQFLQRSHENAEVKGLKIMIGGRLNGADIARKEWLSKGQLPLHTLRADIDFAKAVARTTYGAIGIKVWIYKGEVFDKKNKE